MLSIRTAPVLAGALVALSLVPVASARRSHLPRLPRPIDAYRPSTSVLAVARRLPRRVRRQKPFEVDVQRRFRTKREAALIQAAESLLPPREQVIKEHVCNDERPDPAVCKGVRLRTTSDLWWHDTFDRLRIPYAVTASAVRYYLLQSARLAAGKGTARHGSFRYTARVEHKQRHVEGTRAFDDVHVVTLDLRWRTYTGPLAACSFYSTRVVVFSAAGKALAVIGDGKTMLIVS
jgi:hypothetical protein